MPEGQIAQKFTAERQLRRKQFAESDVSNGELLGAIEALRAEVAELKSSMAQPGSPAEEAPMPLEGAESLRQEVARMVRAISQTKAEISAISHPLAEDDQIKSASNELDAIVAATEAATQSILAAGERLELHMRNLANTHHDDEDIVTVTDQMANEIVDIFQACSFQDITGQRIAKVVKTLRFIQERILTIIGVWGIEAFADMPASDGTDEGDDGNLMNGPQLPNQGITQEDIDAMFF
ncbi:MAG: protein phosphatase CheZ [Rhodospirillales bacterium]|nr:protein phosphatase CheZ [Rhodospirillales bacterium]